MKAYTLRLYGPKLNGTGTRSCVGEHPVLAPTDDEATAFAKRDFTANLAACPYAALVRDGERTPVWEKGSRDG